MEKNPAPPPGMSKNPENNGINYQPQLVSWISSINRLVKVLCSVQVTRLTREIPGELSMLSSWRPKEGGAVELMNLDCRVTMIMVEMATQTG